jgi:hypothetical protein
MDILNKKLPLAANDWTVERGLKHILKLATFVLVPGLHQFTRNRRVLGLLIWFVYIYSVFGLRSMPFEPILSGFQAHFSRFPLYLAPAVLVYAWLLLLVDQQNLEKRRLRFWHIVPLVFSVMAYFAPFHDEQVSRLYVVQQDDHCPVFCKNDVIEYQNFHRGTHKVSAGDYMIVRHLQTSRYSPSAHYLAKMLVVSPKAACGADGRTEWLLPEGNEFCHELWENKYYFDYLVQGGPKPDFRGPEGEPVTMVEFYMPQAYRVRKIGTTHRHTILTDQIMDVVGNSLLIIYKWTGINLLDLDREKHPVL